MSLKAVHERTHPGAGNRPSRAPWPPDTTAPDITDDGIDGWDQRAAILDALDGDEPDTTPDLPAGTLVPVSGSDTLTRTRQRAPFIVGPDHASRRVRLCHSHDPASHQVNAVELRTRVGGSRFLETDPVEGGSANDYDYCNGEPINCYDLSGTVAIAIPGVGVVIVGGFFAALAVVAVKMIAEYCSRFSCTISMPKLPGGAHLIDGRDLRRQGEDLLGRRHSESGKRRWQEWWDGLNKEERDAYNAAAARSRGEEVEQYGSRAKRTKGHPCGPSSPGDPADTKRAPLRARGAPRRVA